MSFTNNLFGQFMIDYDGSPELGVRQIMNISVNNLSGRATQGILRITFSKLEQDTLMELSSPPFIIQEAKTTINSNVFTSLKCSFSNDTIAKQWQDNKSLQKGEYQVHYQLLSLPDSSLLIEKIHTIKIKKQLKPNFNPSTSIQLNGLLNRGDSNRPTNPSDQLQMVFGHKMDILGVPLILSASSYLTDEGINKQATQYNVQFDYSSYKKKLEEKALSKTPLPKDIASLEEQKNSLLRQKEMLQKRLDNPVLLEELKSISKLDSLDQELKALKEKRKSLYGKDSTISNLKHMGDSITTSSLDRIHSNGSVLDSMGNQGAERISSNTDSLKDSKEVSRIDSLIKKTEKLKSQYHQFEEKRKAFENLKKKYDRTMDQLDADQIKNLGKLESMKDYRSQLTGLEKQLSLIQQFKTGSFISSVSEFSTWGISARGANIELGNDKYSAYGAAGTIQPGVVRSAFQADNDKTSFKMIGGGLGSQNQDHTHLYYLDIRSKKSNTQNRLFTLVSSEKLKGDAVVLETEFSASYLNSNTDIQSPIYDTQTPSSSQNWFSDLISQRSTTSSVTGLAGRIKVSGQTSKKGPNVSLNLRSLTRSYANLANSFIQPGQTSIDVRVQQIFWKNRIQGGVNYQIKLIDVSGNNQGKLNKLGADISFRKKGLPQVKLSYAPVRYTINNTIRNTDFYIASAIYSFKLLGKTCVSSLNYNELHSFSEENHFFQKGLVYTQFISLSEKITLSAGVNQIVNSSVDSTNMKSMIKTASILCNATSNIQIEAGFQSWNSDQGDRVSGNGAFIFRPFTGCTIRLSAEPALYNGQELIPINAPTSYRSIVYRTAIQLTW